MFCELQCKDERGRNLKTIKRSKARGRWNRRILNVGEAKEQRPAFITQLVWYLYVHIHTRGWRRKQKPFVWKGVVLRFPAKWIPIKLYSEKLCWNGTSLKSVGLRIPNLSRHGLISWPPWLLTRANKLGESARYSLELVSLLRCGRKAHHQDSAREEK